MLSKNQWLAFTTSISSSIVEFESVHITWGKCKDLGLFRELTSVSLSKSSSEATDNIRKPSEILKQFDQIASGRKQAAIGKSTARQNDNKDLITQFDSNIAQKVVQILCSNLITESLKSLRLENLNENINAQSWKSIAIALKTKCCESLRELSIADTALGDESFSSIGLVLKNLKQIEHLNVSGCRLTSESQKYLIGVIKIHHDISITDNWVSSLRGREQGFETYESDEKGLQSLNMNNNFFNDDTCRSLIRNLEDDTKLKALHLQDNLIREGGIAMFDDFLSRSTTSQLRFVNLGSNPGSKSYCDTLNRNSALTYDIGSDQYLCFIRSSFQNNEDIDSLPVNILDQKLLQESINKVNELNQKVENLEDTLQEKEEENEQLKSIVEQLVSKIEKYKEKAKKASRRSQNVIKYTLQKKKDVSQEKKSNLKSKSTLDNNEADENDKEVSRIVVDIPAPQRINESQNEENLQTEQVTQVKISQEIQLVNISSQEVITDFNENTSPISNALPLAEIEKALENADASNPQIAEIQALTENIKLLSSMVENIKLNQKSPKIESKSKLQSRRDTKLQEKFESNLKSKSEPREEYEDNESEGEFDDDDNNQYITKSNFISDYEKLVDNINTKNNKKTYDLVDSNATTDDDISDDDGLKKMKNRAASIFGLK